MTQKRQHSILLDEERNYDYAIFVALLLSYHLAFRDIDKVCHLALQAYASNRDYAFSLVGLVNIRAWKIALSK